MVKFQTKIGKHEVIQGDIYHYDNKPFIVKEYTIRTSIKVNQNCRNTKKMK